ncbi:MAG: UDP-N-acetylglucosamine 2-epimerase [Candidatus Gracilibacteria bacterium]|nr:UDP-N-acetylglucosamine 2-epimerase [Candidatus Gracilibacteria bacterium]MDD3120081.1 UDP-N-acetylglucosamine 2-epimerase [Candidatus Gracilibacteria bacterium]MDD4530203.1 UDP-N-acetylglucosamine 2-epimerase [Candidatus Gracilibacteria bacterium]
MEKGQQEVFVREGFWEEIEVASRKYAHVIMIATKPDIIKQAPLYLELKSRKELVILVHTGQHYDYNLSKGVLDEFGMVVDVNLNIFGPIHKKFSLVIERLGDFLVKLNTEYQKIPVPYVHGDTLTATTADKAAFLNKFAVVHVEAGIRTLTPKKEFFVKLFEDYEAGKFDFEVYYKSLQDESIYEKGSIEPFPEQFDTRGIEASTGFYAAPVELAAKNLLEEGFCDDRIKVTGNTISDAIKISQTKVKTSKAFEIYPNMKGKDFIFVTLHRRENTEKKERFLALYYGLKKLVKEGVYVCFLALHASEWAIDEYGLRKDLEQLIKDHSTNFAYGPALAHHHEVIDMISKAGAVVTDSGSMQEEANIVNTPCVTLRFGSDRAETLLAGTNVIAPPVNSNLIADIIKGAIGNKNMKKGNLYGENVSEKIVDEVTGILQSDGKLFRFDDERLGLVKYINFRI